jgi:hypothetical protein
MRSKLLLGCSQLLSVAGFAALAAEVSRGARNHHVPLSRCDGGGASHAGRKARARGVKSGADSVHIIPGSLAEDCVPSAVHEITLDDAVAGQEDAIKRAMELMSSVKDVLSDPEPSAEPSAELSAEPPRAIRAAAQLVPTLAPPPSDTPAVRAGASDGTPRSPAGTTAPAEDNILLPNISSILAQSQVLTTGPEAPLPDESMSEIAIAHSLASLRPSVPPVDHLGDPGDSQQVDEATSNMQQDPQDPRDMD